MNSSQMKVFSVAIIISLLAIIALVLYSNGTFDTYGNRLLSEDTTIISNSVDRSSDLVSDIKTPMLTGWMEDEDFFDKEEHRLGGESTSAHLKSVYLMATSIEKNIRIQILDYLGAPIRGVGFEVKVNDEIYLDSDADGLVEVSKLDAGEYDISVIDRDGYILVDRDLTVTVKDHVEYTAIKDISLLIKTEEEIDALNEDGSRFKASIDGTGTGNIRVSNSSEFGIDVSKWNKDIDWKSVKASGVQYAIIRCGYRGYNSGVLVEDPYYYNNIVGANNNDIKVGLYFFTQAINVVEAVEEASMVIEMCKEHKISYPIFIDTERVGRGARADDLTSRARTDICNAFVNTIQSAGYKAGIYANKNWLNNNLYKDELARNSYMWVAEYNNTRSYDGTCHIWQYTSNGSIDGIIGRVDYNESYILVDD